MTAHRNIIAILRGVTPSEVIAVCSKLVEAGITMIEVPFNSPEPLVSIAAAAKEFAGRAEIGCGTALSVQNVEDTKAAGGSFVVSPDTNESVIRRTRALEMGSYPGVFMNVKPSVGR